MSEKRTTYTLDDFDYDLPEHFIAQKPADPRDHSRLMVFDRETGEISDDRFYNIGKYLPKNTSLVVNNSKVEKCRLLFQGGSLEVFVTKSMDPHTVEAMVRPGKKFKPGRVVELDEEIYAEVLNITEDGLRILKLSHSIDDTKLEPFKYTPFPPYMRQDESLADRYQTVYAKDEGSKAAPTAGLHFTPRLLNELEEKGIRKSEVTLHVGLGTFAPVKADRIDDHVMHSEWYRITERQAQALNQAGSLTAVGTTSVRVLESAVNESGRFTACSGETDIFIKPGYQFRSVDHLITNFHLPKSTLLMLVSAFTTLEDVKRMYEHAVREEYRFYSFGDAMLIL